VTIFISVAAYRDPELGPTLRDCIARARYPDELRFGVCWQHDEAEAAPQELADPRMRVIDTPWRESRGACWARAEIMRLWNQEPWFLQIDSHHRFVEHWDAKLLAHAERSGAARPLLSTYAAGYQPGEPTPSPDLATRMEFGDFTPAGIPGFRGGAIGNWRDLDRPLRARFVSGHFLFTLGAFVSDVPYDPELYFLGEEITLAVRAFTHGYTLLHPPEPILFHEYTRAHRRKHWDDHVRALGVEVEWHARDAASLAKVRQFLTHPFIGAFGCGSARSFAEYEAYAGISFAHCAVQDATLQGSEPPNPALPPDWPTESRVWRVNIAVDRHSLPAAALHAPQFWYVGFHDALVQEIYRQDSSGFELQKLVEGGERIVIPREFRSSRRPITWTIWPVSKDGEWLQTIVGPVETGA